ncbi:6-bladed beta-propeller [Belliella pelovolcani]|uniref:6-bladed beta-propeller n=1 Tax=Belliella pelovolcani TaxID=529505 RepID=UPI00391A3658
MIKRICVISVFLIILSCNSKPGFYDESGVLQLKLDDAKLIDNTYFEIIDLIPLETNSQNLMSMELRIREGKDGFFIMDAEKLDAVHHFDQSGKYLGKKAEVGEGPNQLLGLQDYQISDNGNLLLLSSIGDETAIYEKSNAGELSKTFDVDYLANSFIKLEDGGYLLAGGYNSPFVSYRVVKIDSEGIIQESFLPNDYTNMMIPLSERNFYESIDGVNYTEIFNNKVYEYSNGKFSTVLEIDFGKYSIPSEFWDVDINEGFEILMENGFATYKSLFSNSNFYLTNIHIQSKSGFYKKVALINKENGRLYFWEATTQDEDLFSDPIGFKNDEVMFLSYYSVIKEKLGNQVPIAFESKLEETEFDYPVLVRAKINVK